MPAATLVNQRTKAIDLESVWHQARGPFDRSIATFFVAIGLKYVSSSLRTRRS